MTEKAVKELRHLIKETWAEMEKMGDCHERGILWWKSNAHVCGPWVHTMNRNTINDGVKDIVGKFFERQCLVCGLPQQRYERMMDLP